MKNKFSDRIKCQIPIKTSFNKKISEILPCKEYGINLIKEKRGNEIIDKIVEEPLRRACKDLRSKGIETVMSSANKNNLLKEGEKALEREDIEGREHYSDAHTFESAGKGYAWIMLNYSSLSDENKEMLFSIEQVQNNKGVNIGRKIVWFVEAMNYIYRVKKEKN